MNLPFLISDKDWQELKPKEIDKLGKRTDLEPEQQAFLDLFRVVDLRVEWVCGQVVIVRNALVILGLLFLALFGKQAVELLVSYFSK